MSFKITSCPWNMYFSAEDDLYSPEERTFNDNDVNSDENYTNKPAVNNGHIGPILEDTAGPKGPNNNDEQLEDIREQVKKLGISKFKKGACAIDPDSGAVFVRNTPGDYTRLILLADPLPEGNSKVPSLYADNEGKRFVVSRRPDEVSHKEQKSIDREFKREAKISKKLRKLGVHNILEITARKDLRAKRRMTFSEYCNQGNLADMIEKMSSEIERANLIPIMIQIAIALQEMHDAGYCHLDLNPSNIFLVGMKGNDVLRSVIGDLGTVTRQGVRKFCGSLEYVAPEMWGDGMKKHRAKPSMDVFSFGVTLFYVLHGMDDILFRDLVDPEGNVIGIDQSRHEKVAEVQNWLRTGCQAECQEDRLTPFYELVAQCIAFDPKERPTMDVVSKRLSEVWTPYTVKNAYYKV